MSSIRVSQNGETLHIPCGGADTLLALLRRAGYTLPAVCGGRGRCGRCRVSVNGVPRLACRVVPEDGDEVRLPASAGGRILTEMPSAPAMPEGGSGCAAAIDLGTTTLALRLYDLDAGRPADTLAAWNAQASYGADVISRIQYTVEHEGGLDELCRCVREQLEGLLREALARAGRDAPVLGRVAVAGNTVMQSLLAGLSVKPLAAFPFRAESLFRTQPGGTLLGAPVYYAPCAAGFVGGDITAGLLASGLAERDGRFLFLDIGTNGEMALGGRGGFVCCAAAAGPAFEGAGVSCGMPGVDGAVSHVRYNGGFELDVIGGGEAMGLCGSGLIDLTAALVRLGVIDPGGRLLPPEDVPERLRRYVTKDGDGNGLFRLTDRVYLAAGDVRALQLAKAAVAAGVRLLLARQGLTLDALDGVYLAGGFGMYLDPGSAAAIGLLPPVPPGKLHSAGNAALAGASALALDMKAREAALHIAERCQTIELSGQADFADAFADSMTLEPIERR